MGVILTRNTDDISRYTLNVWADSPKKVYSSVLEQIGALITSDVEEVSEENTLVDLTHLELMTSWIEYIRETLDSNLVPTMVETSVFKSKGFYELYSLTYMAPILEMEAILVPETIKWWDEPRIEAEIKFQLWMEASTL